MPSKAGGTKMPSTLKRSPAKAQRTSAMNKEELGRAIACKQR